MNHIAAFLSVFLVPVGPPLILGLGSIVVWVVGRRLQREGLLSTLALGFWGIAVVLTVALRLQPLISIFRLPWQPFFSVQANLLWVSDGWNWYASCLILLLGGVGLLLSRDTSGPTADARGIAASHSLSVIATALLFTNSGNLLTVTLMWVVMDFFMIVRNVVVPAEQTGTPARQLQGLSMLGSLLLLTALLPAGQSGPAEPLVGGRLPRETVMLLLVAASIRAGVYPLHLWLLPHRLARLRLPARFIDHMTPAVCGLWLLGLSSGLAGEELLVRSEFVAIMLLGLLGPALVAYTTTTRLGHTTFVLITSVGMAGLTSILSEARGPAAVLWPTTTFALGGGLWLVGERIWREWGWQIPVSIGALALVGVPFTPGFLTQSAIARLLTGEFSGTLVLPFFIAFVMAQMVYVSALLRSWGGGVRAGSGADLWLIGRLLVCVVALATPLVIAGVFPRLMAVITDLPDAIPQRVGDPPSAVAGWHVWLTLAGPLFLGMGLALLRPYVWLSGPWPERVSGFAALDWFPRLVEWGTSRTSYVWDIGLEIFEGAGYVGWLVAFAAIGYFLLTVS